MDLALLLVLLWAVDGAYRLRGASSILVRVFMPPIGKMFSAKENGSQKIWKPLR